MYNIACAILFAAMTYIFLSRKAGAIETGMEAAVDCLLITMWLGSFICAILP